MPWIIEDLTPSADGSRTTFSVSHAPVANPAMLVFFPAMPDEQVSSGPLTSLQYSISGTTVTFGLPPASGRQPWSRYFFSP